MGLSKKLVEELKELGFAMLYFCSWIGVLVVIKKLVLAEYNISFSGFSAVLLGALVLSKVVLVLQHVSLGDRMRACPAWVDLVARTALYAFGVLVVLILEKAFEARGEYGSFSAAVSGIIQHRDMPHVWTNAICLTGALLSFNILALLRRQLGPGGVARLFRQPLSD